jgi:hypothetical protein
MSRWVEPAYLNDGDEVWLPIEHAQGQRLRVVRCHVVMAQGNHARIYELPFGEVKWHRLSELRVPPSNERTRP